MLAPLLALAALCLHAAAGGCDCGGRPAQLSETFTDGRWQFVLLWTRVTWVEAQLVCAGYNAHLAHLPTWAAASFLASALADSDLAATGAGSVWVGGRREGGQWRWRASGALIANTTTRGQQYPPWDGDVAQLEGKACLALGRGHNDSPLFVPADCRRTRPFVCAAGVDGRTMQPFAAQWSSVRGRDYVLYRGYVTWGESLAFCRAQGMTLATVPSLLAARMLAEGMLRSRPDVESAWIGGVHEDGQGWVWAASGARVADVVDDDGYPPWRRNRSEGGGGCLQLDRHLCDRPVFLPTACDRARSFFCQTLDEAAAVEVEVDFEAGGRLYSLVPSPQPWAQARSYCRAKGGDLVSLDTPDVLNAVVRAMAYHPQELRHVWVDGQLVNGSWVWSNSVQKTPQERFLNFCDSPYKGGDKASFLNLDRMDHDSHLLYALSGNVSQPFVCSAGVKTTIMKSPALLVITNQDWESLDDDIEMRLMPGNESLESTTAFLTDTPSTTTTTATMTSWGHVLTSATPERPTTTTPRLSAPDHGDTPGTGGSPVTFQDSSATLQPSATTSPTTTSESVRSMARKSPRTTTPEPGHLEDLSPDISYSIVSKECNSMQLVENGDWACQRVNKFGAVTVECTLDCPDGYILSGNAIMWCSPETWTGAGNSTITPACRSPEEHGTSLVQLLQTANRNVLFALDSLDDLGQLQHLLNFSAGLQRAVPLSGGRRAGLVLYSGSASTVLDMDADTCAVVRGLGEARLQSTPQGPADLGKAINEATSLLLRHNLTSCILVMVSQRPAEGSLPHDAADKLKTLDCLLVTIGLGRPDNHDLADLASMSPQVQQPLLFVYHNLAELDSVAAFLHSKAPETLDC